MIIEALAKHVPTYIISRSYRPPATVYPVRLAISFGIRASGCTCVCNAVDTGVDKMFPIPRKSIRTPKIDVEIVGSSSIVSKKTYDCFIK